MIEHLQNAPTILHIATSLGLIALAILAISKSG